MTKFDWVPYLEGKYLNYYQWFATIGTFILLCIALLSGLLYLIISKAGTVSRSPTQKKLIDRLKNISFNGMFISLTIIPLIWTAFDGLYLIEGMLLMMMISIIQIYLDNGRQLWEEEASFSDRMPAIKAYLSLCLRLTPQSKKLLKIAAICAVVFPCLLYKTCLCFYNAEVGYYNDHLGFGVNTYLSRMFQLKTSCPPGPPCQMYATVPE